MSKRFVLRLVAQNSCILSVVKYGVFIVFTWLSVDENVFTNIAVAPAYQYRPTSNYVLSLQKQI